MTQSIEHIAAIYPKDGAPSNPDADPRSGATRLAELRDELRARGFFERDTARIVAQLGLALGLLIAGMAPMMLDAAWTLQALGLVVSSAANIAIATIAHSASHYSIARSDGLNRFLTYLGFGFVLGVSVHFWRHKHIRLHHRAPNIDGLDGDVMIAAPFALLDTQLQRAGRWQRIFVRWQWLVIPFALFLNGFAVQRSGWSYLLSNEHGTRSNRTVTLDLAVLLLHFACWVVLPSVLFGPAIGLGGYVLRIGMTGYWMFAAFAPAHYPSPALACAAHCQSEDYVLRQAATTVNFRTGIIGSFLCSGVQYQIEHHLLPEVSHTRYGEVAPFVRELCKRHGYPYREYSWWWGIKESLKAFYRLKVVQQDLRSPGAPNMERSDMRTIAL